jgi:hypothetical protein
MFYRCCFNLIMLVGKVFKFDPVSRRVYATATIMKKSALDFFLPRKNVCSIFS